MNKYKVWFSKFRSIVVRAKSVTNARKQAWEQSSYKYGWKKADFLRNATVEKI